MTYITIFLAGIAADRALRAYRRRPHGQGVVDFLAMTALRAFGVFR